MESKSNFGQEIAESQVAFIKQFDPKSETYHHGDPTPVPIGGDRIPDEMPTAYDIEYMKRAEESEGKTYGAEYERLTEMRTLLLDLKKVLNLVCPPLEAILRIRSQKIDEAKKEKQIDAELAKTKKVTDDIQERFISVLRKTNYADKYVDGLEAICKDAFRKFKDKEDFTNYLFFVKKYTAQTFSDANEILAKLKQIKATYKPPS